MKPGGAVVYSTCSIEPDENEGVVKAVLRGMRGAEARSRTPRDSGQALRRRLLGAVAEIVTPCILHLTSHWAGPVS